MGTKSTLHIVSHAPNAPHNQTGYWDAIASGDAILFIENGVYWLTPSYRSTLEKAINSQVKLHALTADISARGLGLLDKSDTPFHSCSYVDFVELTTAYDNVVSWS